MKKVICLIMTIVLCLTLITGLYGCGKTETFTCDGCGRTISDGKKHAATDAFSDKWNYCDDCYKQLQDMK